MVWYKYFAFNTLKVDGACIFIDYNLLGVFAVRCDMVLGYF